MNRCLPHVAPACAILVLVIILADMGSATEWELAQPRLITRWGKQIDPSKEDVLPEYPRPQMTRAAWQNLNGLWQYNITAANENAPPQNTAGKILVPFCVESALSGVGKRVGAENVLWYRRTFELDQQLRGQRILLHFGAVDWEAKVWVNEQLVGTHRGGYDPFHFDITAALQDGNNKIDIRVWDPTDEGSQPRGKQRNEPRGIWYTPVTGIWQTVWLEGVPKPSHIARIKLTPNAADRRITVACDVNGDAGHSLSAEWTHVALRDEEMPVEGGFATLEGPVGKALSLRYPAAELWTPAQPYLYHLVVKLFDADGTKIDEVRSYTAFRDIDMQRDVNGVWRLELNQQPLFQYGPLDQGWWPDGLYTAPSDEALKYDLEVTRQLGFNMVRKHVKVEPLRWYAWCDRMGLLVWQDMPNGGKHARWPSDGQEIEREKKSAEQFEVELKAIVDALYNSPSIVMWVPFNEAWGQYDTIRVGEWLKNYDRSRLVNAASGGNDFIVGHIKDDHFYPGPNGPPLLPQRGSVLGEFGGLGLPLQEHTWQDSKNWGYRSFTSREDLHTAYQDLISKLQPLVAERICAAVYTQTTDVEIEVNGLMTYDREVIKLPIEATAKRNATLFAPIKKLPDGQLANLATLAWWRFETGEEGRKVPNQKQQPKQIAVRDHSGHNNHLYSFGPPQSPRWTAKVGVSKVPRLAVTNQGCLDDTQKPAGIPSADLFTNPGKSRTHMDVLNTFQFSEFTIEVSFRLARLGQFHGLVGKDGKPTAGPHAPLQLKVRGDDNRIQIEALDSTGQVREVRSREPVQSGKWYHAVSRSDGKQLTLHVRAAGEDNYQLQGTAPFAGQLYNSVGTWTVGRGFYNGRLADDALAWLDEIRVSTVCLPLEQLLFAQP